MYFNIPKKIIKKHEKNFPDLLVNTASVYNDFEEGFDGENEIILLVNQHLKKYAIINSWRKELFYQWDVCRQSLICASAIVKEFCVKYKEDDVSHERIYNELLAEYYLDNISYRFFSILDKAGHPLNLILDFNIPYKKVSYFNIKNKVDENKKVIKVKNIFNEFESNDNILSEFKEYRNALTHRDHLLQPTYEIKNIEVNLDNKNGIDKIQVNIPERSEPQLSIVKLYEIVEEVYKRLTVFLDKLFQYLLDEIIDRYNNEIENSLRTLINNNLKY